MQLAHVRPDHVHLLHPTARSRRDGGFAMVMFGMLLVPLLLMVGLAVDVGAWYNRASDIQKAADAASLAGVVWLPDEVKAREVALQTAAKNGFDNADPYITVIAEKSTKAPRRLKVTIRDERVGSFFYQSLSGKEIDMTRDSFAEYVTPVPMGSPRNFFGLGTVLEAYPVPDMPAEYLYQSVNPYCTDKVNGDRYQSMSSGGRCDSSKLNSEYRDTGYEMYIEALPTRSSDIEVRLYDARYNEDPYAYTVPGPVVCIDPSYPLDQNQGWTTGSGSGNITVGGPLQVQRRANTSSPWGPIEKVAAGQALTNRGDRTRYRSPNYTWPSAWEGPVGGSTNVTVNGLARYQTRSSSTTSTYSSVQTLNPTQTISHRRDRIRYMYPVYDDLPEQCDPSVITNNESAPDDYRSASGGPDTSTFKLFAADDTPLDDSDNPKICEQSYAKDAPFDGYVYLGSRRWNTLCTIPAGAVSGKYILRVTNSGAQSSPLNDGSNQWGLVAKYTDAGEPGLCDGRNDASCPRVYGKDAISVKAAATTTVASFYLAEIGPEHTGKKLKLELFDPGEGGSTIEIQKPTGPNSWTSVPVTWTSVGASPSSGSGSSIDVTGSRFNGRLLEITVDLSGYSPPANNNWWQIKYTFAGTVTDRTTWSARIIGDPVHLIEEN